MKYQWMKAAIATPLAIALYGCGETVLDEDEGDVSVSEATQGLDLREVSPPRQPQPQPPPILYPGPSDVYIQSISTGGVGCPDPSTVTAIISDDRTSFLVIFDEMVLEYPPGPKVKNTNCVAGVKLHIPNGWQFSVATVDTRGYAYLDPGMRARQTSQYFFAGNPLATVYHSSLLGYMDGNYSFTDAIPFTSIVWSPCGGSSIFAIDTQLNLNAIQSPNGLGYFNTTSLDGKFKKEVHWQWAQCH
jgi:hypothetical protein